ncbi:hypothetical protein CWO91_07965 [Bradyrhizobium genosp. SA-3]|nr:hypothetical protein CWO91_07965 [Bradyrhizobium genosp. SA-3]
MASHSLSLFFTGRGWDEGLPPRMRHFIEPNPRPTSVIASDLSAVARRAKAEAKQSRMSLRRRSGLLRRKELLAMTKEADGAAHKVLALDPK